MTTEHVCNTGPLKIRRATVRPHTDHHRRSDDAASGSRRGANETDATPLLIPRNPVEQCPQQGRASAADRLTVRPHDDRRPNRYHEETGHQVSGVNSSITGEDPDGDARSSLGATGGALPYATARDRPERARE
jgi:hypothetical protein